jgi:hypothetical protein
VRPSVRLATNHRRRAGESLRERRNEIDWEGGLVSSARRLRFAWKHFWLPTKQIINGCAGFVSVETPHFTVRSGRKAKWLPLTNAPARLKRRFLQEAKRVLSRKSWCCQTGLNCRPLHYQWSALPLSYGSMPGICEESAQMAAH